MSKTDLQNWLLENSGFNEQYRNLLIESVASQFPNLSVENSYKDLKHDWDYLLLSASLLSQSSSEKCQDVALRISQHCLKSCKTSTTEKDAAAVILDSLANRPAIELAQVRKYLKPDFSERLPFTLYQQWTRRSIENSITLSNSSKIQANKFQCKFWDVANENKWISISAPTSAGKSFIIGRWLAEYLRNNKEVTVVYIVPTRALIQQVQKDIENLLISERISDTSVSTLPLESSIKKEKANIFIFTQERLHILFAIQKQKIHFDLLIVDEAQKVGDNYRGVLLQQAIETITQTKPVPNILFASPMTENPDVLLEDTPLKISHKSIISEDTTVNQNLIWLSQVPKKPIEWNFEILIKKQTVKVGTVKLPSRPTGLTKRLPFLAYTLGNISGGNLIYTNGAAEAEEIARVLNDLVGVDSNNSDDQEISNLIELIQKTIHPDYRLAAVVNRGIAFHYGNMPLLVRTEIERLFNNNKIKFLVCTSTLIEGVNMPCKSIFMRGPTKGRGKPMSPSDFWNLAGRAGRWGKEFQGNIFCVDAHQNKVWKEGAPKGKSKFRITRTADDILQKNEIALLDYINAGTPLEDSRKNQNLEYVFSYLVSTYIQHKNISDAPWAKRYDSELISKLESTIENVMEDLLLPEDVIIRNPGISPISMNNLLKYFYHRTLDRNLDPIGLIPVFPESDDAFKDYIRILSRINKYLGNVFGNRKRIRQLAILIIDWMKGYPLARIISSRESFYEDSKELPEIIRQSMNDVEEFARFQAPKYLACYKDLLIVHLESINREDLIELIPSVNIFLEFGVSSKTQLSLMGLGLSRSAAIALSNVIVDDSFDDTQNIAWLRENDWITKDMPALVKKEIEDMLDRHITEE